MQADVYACSISVTTATSFPFLAIPADRQRTTKTPRNDEAEILPRGTKREFEALLECTACVNPFKYAPFHFIEQKLNSSQ